MFEKEKIQLVQGLITDGKGDTIFMMKDDSVIVDRKND